MSNQTQATQVAARGEREIVTERVFDAPRERVFLIESHERLDELLAGGSAD